jgi:hypothetical protein
MDLTLYAPAVLSTKYHILILHIILLYMLTSLWYLMYPFIIVQIVPTRWQEILFLHQNPSFSEIMMVKNYPFKDWYMKGAVNVLNKLNRNITIKTKQM